MKKKTTPKSEAILSKTVEVMAKQIEHYQAMVYELPLSNEQVSGMTSIVKALLAMNKDSREAEAVTFKVDSLPDEQLDLLAQQAMKVIKGGKK